MTARSRTTASLIAILLPGLSSLASPRPAGAEQVGTATGHTLAQVRDWRQTQGWKVLEDFVELLAIPNVATDTPNIRRNADLIRQELEERGVTAELWTLGAEVPPVVYGYLATEGASRTLGIYVHYDGQPVDESEWQHPAWSPVLYTRSQEDGGSRRPLPTAGEEIDPEWRLYGRSTGDDKAPFPGIFTALDALAAHDRAPTSNLVFLFEGEEEAGSDHLGEYFRQHRADLEVDLWLICDGPVHQSRRPQLVFGVRGYTGLDITVYGSTRYLHSGHYGNWAPNPAWRLANLLATMRTDTGEVLIAGFNDSTAAIGDSERRAMAALPAVDDDLRFSPSGC